jgi:hypothetical protein
MEHEGSLLSSQGPATVSVLSQINPLHNLLPSGLFPSSFPIKLLYAVMRATFSNHFILLHVIILILLGEKYKLWSTSLSNSRQSLDASSLLDPDSLLKTMFLSTLSLRSFHNVKNLHNHHHMALQPNSGPGLPFGFS